MGGHQQNGLSKLKMLLENDQPRAHQKIWRYMSFAQFVSLLHSHALVFTSLHSLAQAHDPFEGSIPDYISQFPSGITQNPGLAGAVAHYNKNVNPKTTFVNCWYMDDDESEAMWKIYGRDKYSVCMQSTYRQLRGWLPSDVLIGKVLYGIKGRPEWQKAARKGLFLFMLKAGWLKHEKEIRAIHFDQNQRSELSKLFSDSDSEVKKCLDAVTNPILSSYSANLQAHVSLYVELLEKSRSPKPKKIPCSGSDFSRLINEVVAAPGAEGWFVELVKSECDEHKLFVKVRPSLLSETQRWAL